MTEDTEQIRIRYRLMGEVLKEINDLEKEDPATRDALEQLRVRLLRSGGLADPSTNPYVLTNRTADA